MAMQAGGEYLNPGEIQVVHAALRQAGVSLRLG